MSAAAAAPQLLVNPGFEQGSTTFSSAGGLISGNMPSGWTDNSDWATPTPSLTYSLSTALPRTSSSGNSVCVQVRSGFSQLVQPVNIKAATDYSLSAWFRVTSAAPVSVSLALQANFAPFNWFGGTVATLTPGSGWSLVTVGRLDELPQPPSGTVSSSVAALFILRVNTPEATVCMDDALLQEAGKGPDAAGPQIVCSHVCVYIRQKSNMCVQRIVMCDHPQGLHHANKHLLHQQQANAATAAVCIACLVTQHASTEPNSVCALLALTQCMREPPA